MSQAVKASEARPAVARPCPGHCACCWSSSSSEPSASEGSQAASASDASEAASPSRASEAFADASQSSGDSHTGFWLGIQDAYERYLPAGFAQTDLSIGTGQTKSNV